MCGIVGLFLKTPDLEPDLGRLLGTMLVEMSSRGPDSAGVAVYGADEPDHIKVTLRADSRSGALVLEGEALEAGARRTAVKDTHLVVTARAAEADAIVCRLLTARPGTEVVGSGHRMEIFKEVGAPADIASRFGLDGMSGTHGVGHTRMATESAVTTDGAHPFSTGLDQCLVHNGSLSNHNWVRSSIVREGIDIDTENDSEVAAGYLTWRMREGLTLGAALEQALADLDGFFTFVVGTENGFGVLRDPIACKPAVMAETDGYVAFASEYRALAGLPDIGAARLFEPEPATVYFWERT